MKLLVMVTRADGSSRLEEIEKPSGYHPFAEGVGLAAMQQANVIGGG